MNTQLFPGIDWVGYIDWKVRDFHSYDTVRGTTYNAYLVRDRKTALIDAVKAPFGDRLLRNITGLVEPERVDYVVCNHAEPDHAGALPETLAALPNATLVCTKKCREVLAAHVDVSDWPIQLVDGGDTIALGNRTLTFLKTPMVHWPESMFTYVPEEKLLFSMDAFGQHYATSERFDDEVALATTIDEARAYYANIVMPFGRPVANLLKQAATMDIAMIAPAHGVIWRRHPERILAEYANWANGRRRPKVVVLYDSMWDSTERMAECVAEGAFSSGLDVKLCHVRRTSLTTIATEVLEAAAVAIGTPTLNQEKMPAVGALLTYLGGLKPVNKAGFAFGSFGWSKGGAERVDEWLDTVKWERLQEPVIARYRPDEEILTACRAAGAALAARARESAELPLFD